MYVALSCCQGSESIRLLHDFDDKVVSTRPSDNLRKEHARLVVLDDATKRLCMATL